MSALSVRRLGSGPVLVLVHGGLGPELTWERQESLSERWTLTIPTRRGFPGSASADRQDFEADADDLSELVDEPAHLVGFSYGGLGATLLAARDPGRVRSLTLVEVPLYLVAPENPAVQEIARAGDAFLSGDADERTERGFLADAGIDPSAVSGRTAARVEEAVAAARGGRSPSEARPNLDAIADASLPVMVASGDHHEGIEILCDALAGRLVARREILPGAGHAVPRAPGFNQALEAFLTQTERR
jgi:pimeloyl-ACP methyl ester carboxylesterase